MLYSIYHVTLKLLKITFWRENVKKLPSFMQRYNGRHNAQAFVSITSKISRRGHCHCTNEDIRYFNLYHESYLEYAQYYTV